MIPRREDNDRRKGVGEIQSRRDTLLETKILHLPNFPDFRQWDKYGKTVNNILDSYLVKFSL